MKYFFLMVLMMLSGVMQAQDFQPWYVDSELRLINPNERIGDEMIKTEKANSDSTVFDLSSVLIERTKWECIVDSVSFLGNKIEVNVDTTYLFTNKGERLKMYHDLSIGLEWQFSDSLTAIVDTILITTVLEKSVEKAFVNIISSDSVFIGVIEIGKGIGILNGFNFWDLTKNFSQEEPINLWYSKRGNLGVKPTGFKEMFSLLKGTVIKEIGIDIGPNTGSYHMTYNNELKIIKKEWREDSSAIRYEIGVVAETVKVHYADNTVLTEYYCDTIEVTRYSELYDFEEGKMIGRHLYYYNEGNWYQGGWFHYDGVCYEEAIDGSGYTEVYENYGDGFYRDYQKDALFYTMGTSTYLPDSNWLDDGTWGCPVDVINGGIDVVSFDVEIKPTLVKDNINVSVNENAVALLYSSNGVKVFEEEVFEELTIPVKKEWGNQLFYKLVSNLGKVKSGKLFVE